MFSICIAALSLGWQIALWLLGGRRVKVSLLHGVAGRAGIAAGPVSANPAGRIEAMRSQGFNGPELLGIEVVNVGRLPVTVTEYTVRLRGGAVSFTPKGDALGQALPFRLEPGEAESWYVDIAAARTLAQAHRSMGKPGSQAIMSVRLGTKQEKRTRQSLRVL